LASLLGTGLVLYLFKLIKVLHANQHPPRGLLSNGREPPFLEIPMKVIPFPDRLKKYPDEPDFSNRFMRRIMDIAKEHTTDEVSLARSVCSIVEDLVKSTDRIRKTIFVNDENTNLLIDDPRMNQKFAELAAEFPCLAEFIDLDAITAIELFETGFQFKEDARLALHFLFHMFGLINRFNLRDARQKWSPGDWNAYIRVCQSLPPVK